MVLRPLWRLVRLCALCLAVSAMLVALSAQRADKDAKAREKEQESGRPQLRLKAQPMISMAPSRVVLTAELVGGPNDAEEFYCPSVEWDWGDGTQSESAADCAPYEPGKSEIKRRFSIQHVFRAGAYRVMLKLKRRDKPVATAAVSIQVRPGVGDIGQ